MRVLVCGSRDYDDKLAINNAIYRIVSQNDDVVIIEGGARGADSIARECALLNKLGLETYHAEWNKYGKRAGFLRNQQMLDDGKPDLVLAFFSDLKKKSRGTGMMVEIAKKAGVRVEEYGREN